MFERDEAWERRAALDHARFLVDLLRKGQDVDADADGTGDTLRGWFISLRREIDKALSREWADVDPRAAVMKYLYDYRREAGSANRSVDIATIAHDLGQSMTHVAVLCSSMTSHGHVLSDGDMLGYVRLSDDGAQYFEELYGSK